MLRNAFIALVVTRRDDAPDPMRAELRQTAYTERRVSTPDCLDEVDVAGFVDGALSDDERMRALAHLTGCAHCRAAVRATTMLVGDTSVALELPDARRRRRMSTVAAVGVAAALLLMVMPLDDARRDVRTREPAINSTIAPVALAPSGAVPRLDRLLWTSVPGAQRYRVHLHNADGASVWSAQTHDTTLVVPDSVRLTPGAAYSWRVEAQTDWQRWVASQFTPVSIRGSPR